MNGSTIRAGYLLFSYSHRSFVVLEAPETTLVFADQGRVLPAARKTLYHSSRERWISLALQQSCKRPTFIVPITGCILERRLPKVSSDEAALTAAITELATKYGRYGYCRTTALLRQAGWHVNSKRVERIWRQEGLKVPAQQPKRERLWLGDGSCIRLRPEHKDHVWAYDFVADRTAQGKAFRMLTVVDEYTRECLAIVVNHKLDSSHVLETLAELFVSRGPPEHLRSDNGPEFCAQAVKNWLHRLAVKTLFIEPGSPWENGYVESFNGKLRDELLNGERFTTLLEAKVLIADWRYHYNRVRPHSALGYRPPAPEATLFPRVLPIPLATPDILMR